MNEPRHPRPCKSATELHKIMLIIVTKLQDICVKVKELALNIGR